MGKILKVLWFTTKASVAGGAVYMTYDKGVWGPPEQSKKLFSEIWNNNPWIKTLREDYVGDFIPKDFGNINYRDYWNSGVLATFGFIADSPSKVVALKNYLVDSVSSFTSEEPKKEDKKMVS